MNLQHLKNPLESILRQAGEILLDYFNTDFTVKKKPQAGLVTDADFASEKFIKAALADLVPGAAMLAEESGQSGSSDYCWVIDPLDGTNNFAHGLPYFCVSIALTYKGVPQIGGIYQPLLKELFYAQKNGGATLNGRPTKVSALPDLSESTILVGLPYAKDEAYKNILSKLQIIGPDSYSIRHMGAAALDCAYVASGRLDAVFFANLKWWDAAAGVLLIQEAGGIATDFNGQPVDKDYRSFVAANPDLHAQLRQILAT